MSVTIGLVMTTSDWRGASADGAKERVLDTLSSRAKRPRVKIPIISGMSQLTKTGGIGTKKVRRWHTKRKLHRCVKCGRWGRPPAMTKHSLSGNHKPPFVYMCRTPCHDEEHKMGNKKPHSIQFPTQKEMQEMERRKESSRFLGMLSNLVSRVRIDNKV